MNKQRKEEIINSLTEAQKIAFAPITFQAINSMLSLGILKTIDQEPIGFEDLMKELKLSEYTISSLLELGEVVGVVAFKDNKFSITSLGKAFLYDEMTRVNFNFVKDVCYSGAQYLTDSFLNSKPEGFRKLFEDAETIYPYLSQLPENMRKSWYEFDHYYSDNCFEIIYAIIKGAEKVFDIGGNTGRFEKTCLKNDPNIDITMIDLKENIDFIKNDPSLKGCKFHAADMLSEDSVLPKISGAVLMSQFLDCFSKEQIVFILKKINKYAQVGTKIYILEPFIDKQRFWGAKNSLVHTSLYFTCMANGCSKMYSQKEMEALINTSGLKVQKVYDSLGAHDYTLLECVKNG